MSETFNTFNTPQFRKAFAAYSVVLLVGLMGASWIRAENLPTPDAASFIGTMPAATGDEPDSPTF